MRKLLMSAAALLPLFGGGCVAKTAFNVATMPVKAVGKTADWATTSQSEADRNAGRKLRKEDEKRAREARAEEKRRDRERRESDRD